MSEPDPRPSPRDPYRADDEISLYDLWWTLMRRKWVIIGVTVVCIALGVIHALLREPEYNYATTLEIGRIAEPPTIGGSTATAIESPSSVSPLVADTLIPMVRSQIRQEAADGARQPDVSVSVPDGDTRLLMLRSQGTTERAEQIATVHERILKELKSEHDSDYDRAHRRLERHLEDARARMAAELDKLNTRQQEARSRIQSLEREKAGVRDESRLQERATRARLEESQRRLDRVERERATIEGRIERLEAEHDRLDNRMADTEERLARAREREERAASEAGDEARAMTLLLIQAGIEDMRNRLDDLQDQRFRDLPDRESYLRLDLADKRDERESERDRIEELEARLENIRSDREREIANLDDETASLEAEVAALTSDAERRQSRFERLSATVESAKDRMRPTQARVVALQSFDAVSAGSSLIIALSVILGGMLGVFAAFFSEFVSNARRLAERSEE